MVDIVRPVYGEAWASSGEKLSPTEIKVQSGWVQEMMPYQWENFLQNRQDTTLLYLLQKGVPEWSVDQEYIGNKSIVTYNGYTYQAKSTNTGNLPIDSVYWKRTSPNVTDVGVVTLSSGGTGATNATDARTNLGLGTAATVSADTIVFKSITGNAPAADKWTSPISLSLSGGATGNTSLDGSGNATINVSGLNASSISSGTVPSSALTNATLKTSPVGSTILAAGLTSERDLSPFEGYTRWNKTTKVVEVFNGTSWTVNTNQSEDYLLNRANHTGTQPIATVTGLQTALDSKLSSSGGVLSDNLTVPSLNGGPLAGMRNKIINGGCQVTQRSVPTITASPQYGSCDRHIGFISGGSGISGFISQNPNASFNSGFAFWLASVSYTSGTWAYQHRIEGLNCRNLNGKTVTVSFKIAQDFGTARPVTVSLAKANSNDNFGTVTTVGSAVTTAAIPSNISATTTISCQFTIPAGDADTGLMLQIADSTATTVTTKNVLIGDIQLETGSVATPFEFRAIGLEEVLCKRYYQTIRTLLRETTNDFQQSWPVSMRASPTLTLSPDSGSGGVVSPDGVSAFRQTSAHSGLTAATLVGSAEL